MVFAARVQRIRQVPLIRIDTPSVPSHRVDTLPPETVPTHLSSIVSEPVLGSVCRLLEKNNRPGLDACPHTFVVPPPPHVSGWLQEPQLVLRDVPQLSLALTVLQFLLSRVQNAALLSGVQLQTFSAPHVCG